MKTPPVRGLCSLLLGPALGLLLLAACAAPVQVDRVDLRSAYDELNRTALSSDQLSEFTRTVLRRAALLDYFDAQPDATIAALRAQAIGSGMSLPDLYALSEMSYYEGRRTKSKAMLLASALYAYAVLFPAGDAAVTLAFAASLFTHLLEPDARHYLREVARVLAPGVGSALLSIHVDVPPGERYVGGEPRIDRLAPLSTDRVRNGSESRGRSQYGASRSRCASRSWSASQPVSGIFASQSRTDART